MIPGDLSAMVLKSGMFAAAAIGDPNASIPPRDGATLTLSFEHRQR